MISLKEALKLIKMTENEVVYIKKEYTGKFDGNYYSLREIRNTFDIKNRKVTSIQPRFDSDGEYCGMEFEIL